MILSIRNDDFCDRSAAVEATGIFSELVKRKLKSICFVRARKTAEGEEMSWIV